jgi:galactosamine-6-phosphate isomerase
MAGSAESMSRRAADLILDQLKQKPNLLLCAATGATPTHTYACLAEERTRNPALFRQMRVVKLDEWGGLEMDDPASCESYIQRHLIAPLELPVHQYYGFKSNPSFPEEECARVQSWLNENGPIDLCILGLGLNGHLGLNEPADVLEPFTHPTALTASSLAHLMLEAARTKPSYGLTLGLAEILASKKILLLVSGARKREALKRLAQPDLSTRFPASFLWLHQKTICLCDSAAAEGILPGKS